MDYKERFKEIVFEKGFYDEDCKMTIFTPKEEIEGHDPYYDMKYLTLIVDEEDNLQAGIDRNGFLFIETLSEGQIEFLVKEVEETQKAFSPFYANITALVIAVLMFIGIGLKNYI